MMPGLAMLQIGYVLFTVNLYPIFVWKHLSQSFGSLKYWWSNANMPLKDLACTHRTRTYET